MLKKFKQEQEGISAEYEEWDTEQVKIIRIIRNFTP